LDLVVGLNGLGIAWAFLWVGFQVWLRGQGLELWLQGCPELYSPISIWLGCGAICLGIWLPLRHIIYD
jgi:hypothetical protein